MRAEPESFTERRPLHVLTTADTIGGVWTYSLALAEALQGRVHFSVATMGRSLRPHQKEAAARAGVTVYESQFRLEWMDDPWPDVEASCEWLMDLKHALQPDIVHLNTFAHGHLPWDCPVLIVGHSCVLSWWHAVKGGIAPSQWDTYRRRVREGLRSADYVVAPTSSMLAALRHHYGPLPQCRTIYNGIAMDQHPRGSHGNLVFSAGRMWDEAKNVRLLANVAPDLSWPVTVAGETASPEESTNNLRFTGSLSPSEVRRWMANASIYTLPALYEPFGLSALEAASAGCALVLGDIPSLREVWGDAALFVNPHSAASLHNAIESLIADAGWREAMRAQSNARSQRYSAAAMATAYDATYRYLLAHTSRPAAMEVY